MSNNKTSAPLPPQPYQQPQHPNEPQQPYGNQAYAAHPPQQPAVTGNTMMAVPVVPYDPEGADPVVSEMIQRRKWRRKAAWVIVLATIFIIAGSSCIHLRNDMESGSCCLPRGCDVTKLNNANFSRPQKNNNGRCIFSDAEWTLMGCPMAPAMSNNCTLTPVPDSDDHDNDHHDHDDHGNPCDSDPALTGLIGAGVSLIVTGCIGVLYGFLFLFQGYECYGAREHEKTCGNKCARVATGFIWGLCIAGAINGIVFGSIFAHHLNDPFDTMSSCEVDGDDSFTCEQNGHGRQWEGSCPLSGRPADVFTFVKPTTKLHVNAAVALTLSVGSIVACIAVVARLCRRCCCGRKDKSYYTAQPAAQVGQQVQQPIATYGSGEAHAVQPVVGVAVVPAVPKQDATQKPVSAV